MRWTRQGMATAMILAGTCLLATAGCQEAPVPPPVRVDLESVGLKSMWRRQVRLEPDESIGKVWRTGASIYLATAHSRLIRLDAKSGVVAWDIALGEENGEIYRPVEIRGAEGPTNNVLVVTRGQAFMLDKRGGVISQQSSLGISVTTDPVVVGNTLCVGGTAAYLGYFVDRLGTPRWRTPAPGDFFVSSPVVLEADVIVASKHGKLWRVSVDTGDWEWKDRKTNGDVVAPLTADARAVYVACMDQKLYAFDMSNGGELWESQLEGTLDQQPALGAGVVMVPVRDRGLFGLDRTSGNRKWLVPDVTSVGTVLEDRAWVGDRAGNLKAVKLATGEVLSTTPIPEAQFFVRNTSSDDQIILVNRSGVIATFSPMGGIASTP